jgi:DNA-binding MarR family transcriptional regulator
MKEDLLLDNEYIIMSEVSENENVTQRELSKKLGVSVSTVNILMNKMIREGLIKMTQVSQKQVLYMLTPVGMMEKAQKTVRYLKGHYRAIYETKEKIKAYLDELVKDYDIIYVLMSNDEMGEILTIAVHEYKAKHIKACIELINSLADIDVNMNKHSVLIHMSVYNDYDETISEDVINEYKSIMDLDVMNLLEKI